MTLAMRSAHIALSSLVALASTTAVSNLARAEDTEQGQSDVQLVARQDLVALLNPMGAEHRFELALRGDLGDQTDVLFQGAHLQGGVTSYASPVYVIGGGYMEFAPFSFLSLRGDLLGAGIWPIGMSGAGYYGVSGYDADVRSQSLPAEAGRTATGWIASGSMTLQGAIDFGGGTRVVFANEFGVSYVVVGGEGFYYSMKSDLILAREDVLLTNSGFLGIEHRVAQDMLIRVGAYDDLRYVPASGYVGHQVGPIAMVEWQRPAPSIGALTVFVRGGGYTHHLIRAEEATILGGVSVDYTLGGL